MNINGKTFSSATASPVPMPRPTFFGLIETAKANKIEPYRYLRWIFTELPKATSLEEIEALLPAEGG